MFDVRFVEYDFDGFDVLVICFVSVCFGLNVLEFCLNVVLDC